MATINFFYKMSLWGCWILVYSLWVLNETDITSHFSNMNGFMSFIECYSIISVPVLLICFIITVINHSRRGFGFAFNVFLMTLNWRTPWSFLSIFKIKDNGPVVYVSILNFISSIWWWVCVITLWINTMSIIPSIDEHLVSFGITFLSLYFAELIINLISGVVVRKQNMGSWSDIE